MKDNITKSKTKHNTNRIFNTIAPIYGLFYNRQKKHYNIVLDKIKNTLDLSKYNSIIDIGCGTGALCSVLNNKGLKVTGIDASLNMLNIGQKKKENNSITFIEGSILNKTPYEDDTFDISIACHVTHGINKHERKKMYIEMKRITKELIIIYDYNEKRNIFVSIIEWFEGGDYFNFIKTVIPEMKEIFDQVTIINVDSHASFYICK